MRPNSEPPVSDFLKPLGSNAPRGLAWDDYVARPELKAELHAIPKLCDPYHRIRMAAVQQRMFENPDVEQGSGQGPPLVLHSLAEGSGP